MMQIQKNVAGQGVYLAAYDTTATPAAGKTGDAPNITGFWSKDGGVETNGFTTAHPTEIGHGVYWQPLTQGETNGDRLSFAWSSSTTGIVIDPLFGETTGVFLTTALSAARALDAIADTSLTLNDALHCAIAAAVGKETQTGTAYVIKTPSTATVLRTFTLDSASTPTSRS